MKSVWACVPCYLSKGSVKRDFLDIFLTKFFGVRNFKNTSVMRVLFFSKMLKIESKNKSWDFAYHSERLFKPEVPSQGSIDMVKVLSFSFEQCFGPLTMLLVEGSSETGLFGHLSNHLFPSPEVQKYISYEGHHFFQSFQNWV